VAKGARRPSHGSEAQLAGRMMHLQDGQMILGGRLRPLKTRILQHLQLQQLPRPQQLTQQEMLLLKSWLLQEMLQCATVRCGSRCSPSWHASARGCSRR
jgi:hypothetical protein